MNLCVPERSMRRTIDIVVERNLGSMTHSEHVQLAMGVRETSSILGFSIGFVTRIPPVIYQSLTPVYVRGNNRGRSRTIAIK